MSIRYYATARDTAYPKTSMASTSTRRLKPPIPLKQSQQKPQPDQFTQVAISGLELAGNTSRSPGLVHRSRRVLAKLCPAMVPCTMGTRCGWAAVVWSVLHHLPPQSSFEWSINPTPPDHPVHHRPSHHLLDDLLAPSTRLSRRSHTLCQRDLLPLNHPWLPMPHYRTKPHNAAPVLSLLEVLLLSPAPRPHLILIFFLPTSMGRQNQFSRTHHQVRVHPMSSPAIPWTKYTLVWSISETEGPKFAKIRRRTSPPRLQGWRLTMKLSRTPNPPCPHRPRQHS